ncbi:hypothetical protein SDC9_152711 [bioreactor metagenome]|uniref:Amino-acid carrier protein AlsT n=1 Tax=bioreactor metagenome TaxID=1076179 RepID=A0A645ETV0_9ZZZZ
MVHCTARTDHPVRQGLYGLFEVFMDTIIICNLTALTILATGVLTGQPELTGAQLSLAAFSAVLGPSGIMILSVALALFALQRYSAGTGTRRRHSSISRRAAR